MFFLHFFRQWISGGFSCVMEEITRWRSTFDLAMVAMTSAREVWKRGHVETGELEIQEASSASVFDVSSSKLCF